MTSPKDQRRSERFWSISRFRIS